MSYLGTGISAIVFTTLFNTGIELHNEFTVKALKKQYWDMSLSYEAHVHANNKLLALDEEGCDL